MRLKTILLACLACSFFACKEVPPTLTNVESERKVLIEEFTGVRCVNCPAGAALIEQLLASNNGQLIAVSIHAGEFVNPYPNSQWDFRTEEGTQLLNYVGAPLGYPTAVVNRRKFDGEFDRQLGQGQWAGYIAQEKAVPPKVQLGLQADFDEDTREVGIRVVLIVEEPITDPDVRLSIMITENNIQDPQKVPGMSDPQPDYTHKHVLRGMATKFDGDPVAEELNVVGTLVEKDYTFTLPANWKEQDCKVVAFVSLAGASRDVLQAAETVIVNP